MSKWLKLLIIITLALGIFFRFANLDRKVYSADEVRKIYRISGYTSQKFIEQVFTGNIISVEKIQNYQKLSPDKSWNDTLNALSGNPEHPPLYFLITRFFMQFVNLPIVARLISILSSLLLFPSIYWLCNELFQSSLFGWISISLIAISPLQIHAAQNASQYSLWMLITTLSSAALLRALSCNNKNNWVLYSFTLITGFYTHLFFVIVPLTHGVYTFIIERFRLTKKLVNYLLASLASLLLFSPWIIVILSHLGKFKNNTAYYRQFHSTLKNILDRFLSNLGNIFIDFHNSTRIEKYLDYLVFAIIGYSIYILCRNTQPRVWLFILTLIVITPLAHILPNFISSSARPLQARYYLPCYLGIELSVTYLIGYSLWGISLAKWQKILGKLILIFILSLGVISGIFITQIHDWGLDDQKGTANGRNLELAPIINQADEPLVISEATHSFVLGLSYLVDGKTKFMLLKDQDLEQWDKKLNFSQLTQQFNDIFIYFPDQTFIDYLEQDQNLQLELVKKGLYKVNSY